MAHCNVATFDVINKFIVRLFFFFNVQNKHFVKIHWTLSGNGPVKVQITHINNDFETKAFPHTF